MHCSITIDDVLGGVHQHSADFADERLAQAGALQFAAELLGKGRLRKTPVTLTITDKDGGMSWLVTIGISALADDDAAHDPESEAHPS